MDVVEQRELIDYGAHCGCWFQKTWCWSGLWEEEAFPDGCTREEDAFESMWFTLLAQYLLWSRNVSILILFLELITFLDTCFNFINDIALCTWSCPIIVHFGSHYNLMLSWIDSGIKLSTCPSGRIRRTQCRIVLVSSMPPLRALFESYSMVTKTTSEKHMFLQPQYLFRRSPGGNIQVHARMLVIHTTHRIEKFSPNILRLYKVEVNCLMRNCCKHKTAPLSASYELQAGLKALRIRITRICHKYQKARLTWPKILSFGPISSLWRMNSPNWTASRRGDAYFCLNQCKKYLRVRDRELSLLQNSLVTWRCAHVSGHIQKWPENGW